MRGFTGGFPVFTQADTFEFGLDLILRLRAAPVRARTLQRERKAANDKAHRQAIEADAPHPACTLHGRCRFRHR
ncbi:hypothetical protein [Amycolatopsis saalfeldensis]|uniref:Uncharacterized protein n=1 Tax=Amycolatopsis saalfeldensis TaxID=394193 RepID=A0A1H8XXC3_9PSEU|nr:hypothetical protein [Amycolatopsis saalfeldensis]SEP44402.1 hypothetical protein SAMN04489732_109228 [Amycolatopsis saalfeldensis]